jgi:transcriptional repressor NrdR
MKCPFCGVSDDKVLDSRESNEGSFIRRRRACLKCDRRFTTYERIEDVPFMVEKKDGRREPFNRQKLLAGLVRACEKRPISPAKVEGIVNSIEQYVHDQKEHECPTTKIGEMVMRKLKELDQVAYVRFASVYLDFQDVSDFMSEVKTLAKKKK